MRNDLITLVGATYSTDAIGQKVRSESSRTVFCELGSVTASEFFEAGRNGLKAEYRCKVAALDYQGEQIASYNGTRYGVYRTYLVPDSDDIELYLERKAGL